MPTMINVLVSGAGGDVGQGVMKSLLASSLPIKIFTTCISENSSWLYNIEHSFIAPLSKSKNYISFLIKLIRKFNIDIFFPTVDSEIYKVSINKDMIEKSTNCIVFVGAPNQVKITDDKLKTAQFLKSNGFSSPKSVAFNNNETDKFLKCTEFPIILKSRTGQGARQVFKINSEKELREFNYRKGFMLQEWLRPEEGEYTSGIYLGEDHEVKGICTFKRQLKNGSTFVAERVVDKLLEDPLIEIAQALGLKYVNIQSMKFQDKLIPFELNGRLSGTTSMVSRVFNAPELFIREMILKEKVSRCRDKTLFIALRYYEEIFTSRDEMVKLITRSQAI